jgi:phytoene dehydrogenase-like protein
MEDFLGGLTENQSIIDISIQHFFRKTPTYFALGYFYVYLDYFYPKGGTGAIKNLLTEKIQKWGGQIELNKQIVEVLPSMSVALDADGNSYAYDHLIWAADLKTYYQILNPAGLDARTAARIEGEKQRMFASKGAESVFLLYLSVNRPPSFFKEKGGEHLFFTPSRQGLGEIIREERTRLLADFDRAPKAEVIAWLESFCDLNTYEVSIPVLRDSALAPEGQTGLMISCLFDYELTKKVENAGWYDEFKERVENRIIDLFSKSIYPGLKDDILSRLSATPVTINKVSGSSEGAITGWSFEAEPPVIYKLTDVGKSVLTPLPNVYQAGQWAYAPAGVPIAMLTAWHAYQNIKKKTAKAKGAR